MGAYAQAINTFTARLPRLPIPKAILPGYGSNIYPDHGLDGRLHDMPSPEPADRDGTPLAYYAWGFGDKMTAFESLRYTGLMVLTGLAARGEILSAVTLLFHWIGVDLPYIRDAALGDWRVICAYLVLSAAGAAHTYYHKCLSIYNTYHMKQRDACLQWKAQPDRWLPIDIHRTERRLGTFNAAVAAVLGMSITLLHLKGGKTKLYFDVNQHGLLWYCVSWLVFLTWIEFFAYWNHRFFHLKFMYKHLHKLHHKFQPPTPFSAIAFHPVEFAFYVLGGQAIFFFVPIHFTVQLVVGLYTAYYLIEDHSGVKLTSPFPWQPTSKYHDDHHRYFHCNFGQHVLWFDWVFNTLRKVDRHYDEDTFGGYGAVKSD